MPGSHSNLFAAIEAPKLLHSDAANLKKLGLNVMELARNQQLRREHRIEKAKPVKSSSGKFLFPAVKWQRNLGVEVDFTLIDKTENRQGIMLLAKAEGGRPDHTAVQVIGVNDIFVPFKGLRRLINDSYPHDVANAVADAFSISETWIELDTKPGASQLRDYSKALASVYYP